MRPSRKSEYPWYVPFGFIPCSSPITSQASLDVDQLMLGESACTIKGAIGANKGTHMGGGHWGQQGADGAQEWPKEWHNCKPCNQSQPSASRSTSKIESINAAPFVYAPFTPLLPAPVYPKTKLSTLKGWPKGPALTMSIAPGSRSIKMTRGT